MSRCTSIKFSVLATAVLAACSTTPNVGSGTTGARTSTAASGTSGAASSGTSTGGSGTGTSTGASSSLSGAQAFTVQSALMLPSLAACGACGTAPGGQLNATEVVLADQNVSPAACGTQDGGFPPTHLLNIQIVGENYVSCANGATDSATALAVGSYPILNEDVSDQDVCGNIPASRTAPLAILSAELCDGDAGCGLSPFWAVAGAITLSALDSSGVSGTFDVILGNSSVADAGELQGTFDALACP